MKKLPTITIGMSVFNEERNIIRIIETLLSQTETDFKLNEIVIISDGSYDQTVSFIQKHFSNNKKIRLIIGKKRKGKPARINEIFRLVTTDVIVILDGDIVIKSKSLIAKLVNPIVVKKSIELSSGKAQYLPPIGRFEKIMQAGIDMWNDAKQQAENAQMYTCEGQIRAFSKQLYSQITFPQYSADDIYPYLYCYKHTLGYKHVPSAIIYYKLPSSMKDFVRQHIRYLRSQAIQERSFDKKMVADAFVIGTKAKLTSFVSHFVKNPVNVALYTCMLFVPKILVNLGEWGLTSQWSIIESTKL